MTWIDIATLIIVGYAVFKGYSEGLIGQLASLSGLVVGAIFAGKVAGSVEPVLTSIFKSRPQIVGSLSYVAAFVLILIGFSFLGKLLKGFVKAIHIGFLNNLAGSAFSALKWLLIFSVFLNVAETLDSRGGIIKADTKEKSFSHKFVKSLMPTIVPYLSSLAEEVRLHQSDKEKEKGGQGEKSGGGEDLK